MSLQRMFPFEPSKNPGETFEGWATESRHLSVLLRQMLAHRTSAGGGGCSLPLMATPTTQANQLSPSMMKHVGCRHWANHPSLVGGIMNPAFVEWLMGWPIGWTDCEPLETDKCQWPQRPPGTF